MPDEPIQITRYPNRRFYDTKRKPLRVAAKRSRRWFATASMVEIRDSQTDEDLTRVVLTRIIMERQPEKMQLFPVDMLHFILRSNDVMSDFLRDYFRHALPYLEYLQRHSTAADHWCNRCTGSRPGWTASCPASLRGQLKRHIADDAAPLDRRVAELEERIRQLESGNAEEAPRQLEVAIKRACEFADEATSNDERDRSSTRSRNAPRPNSAAASGGSTPSTPKES